MSAGVEGLLLVDKPSGPTSHDLVAAVRRATHQRRVGHAGTLDPLATGLLPLVLGRATRLVRFLPGAPKVYRGSLELGRVTATDDVTGSTLSTFAGALPTPPQVVEAARAFLGRQHQAPPAFSARKVGGRRLYELARGGHTVEVAPAEVQVLRFDVAPAGPAAYTFEVVVSAGTYVRSLVRDLGMRLGCGATMASLRRTAIGPLDVADALPFPVEGSVEREALLHALVPLEEMPLDPPALRLEDPDDALRFRRGMPVAAVVPGAGTLWRVYHPRGALLGVGQVREGRIYPQVVLAGSEP